MITYRLFLIEHWDQSLATIDEAIDLRRRLTKENERAAGTSLAMSLAIKGWTLSASGQLDVGCDVLSDAVSQLIRVSRIHGNALHREAKEIGGRYVEAFRRANRGVNSKALKELKQLTEIEGFGPIS